MLVSSIVGLVVLAIIVAAEWYVWEPRYRELGTNRPMHELSHCIRTDLRSAA